MDAALRNKTVHVLDELAGAVEELLLTGVTTASAGARERLGVGFQEAGRHKLLRLASTLRIVMEELRRFDADPGSLAPERLAFFLDRAWLLSRAMGEALERGDDAAWNKLVRTPEPVVVASVRAVVVGVFKRHVPGAFSAFELRMRTLDAAVPLAPRSPISTSFVFPARPGVAITPETFLHLDQPQKFRPAELLEGKEIRFEQAALAIDGSVARLTLSPKGRVELGPAFGAWPDVFTWDREAARERVAAQTPDPLALPVELQEEAVLRAWTLSPFRDVGKPYQIADVDAEGIRYEVRSESAEVREALTKAAARPSRPAMLGLLHYELCRFVFTPLSLLEGDGPPALVTLTLGKVDKAALVRAMQIR